MRTVRMAGGHPIRVRARDCEELPCRRFSRRSAASAPSGGRRRGEHRCAYGRKEDFALRVILVSRSDPPALAHRGAAVNACPAPRTLRLADRRDALATCPLSPRNDPMADPVLPIRSPGARLRRRRSRSWKCSPTRRSGACRRNSARCARASSFASTISQTRRGAGRVGGADRIRSARSIPGRRPAVPLRKRVAGRCRTWSGSTAGPILDYWAEHDEALGTIVTHVLVHEIGHHFGLSDDDIAAIEEAPADAVRGEGSDHWREGLRRVERASGAVSAPLLIRAAGAGGALPKGIHARPCRNPAPRGRTQRAEAGAAGVTDAPGFQPAPAAPAARRQRSLCRPEHVSQSHVPCSLSADAGLTLDKTRRRMKQDYSNVTG